MNVNIRNTSGSIENLRLCLDGEADIAFCGPITVDDLEDKEDASKISILYTGHNQPMQAVVREDSGILTWDDFRGKRVCVGAFGSGNDSMARKLLGWYGISYSDITPVYLSYYEVDDALKNKKIDVAMIASGIPTPSLTSVCNAINCRLVSMDRELVQSALQRYPLYSECIVPGSTYPGQSEEIYSVGYNTLLVVRLSMDENLAYSLTKAIHANVATIIKANPAGREWSGEPYYLFRGLALDFHPGARRYFEEVGIWKHKP